MLHGDLGQFLEYCRLVDFSNRSIQALTVRLNEFVIFLKLNRIRSVKRVSYQHPIEFCLQIGRVTCVGVSGIRTNSVAFQLQAPLPSAYT